MARLKITTAAPKTREEMEVLVGDIAALKIKERRLHAEMDLALKQVRDQFSERLANTTEALAGKLPRALAWAEAHPDDFGQAKSIEMLHGIIGWRTNTPSLKTLAGWTWDRVLEKIRAGSWVPYLRVKEEVNKQALIADRDILGPDVLKTLGVKVVQEDEFFVEPKLTEADKREVVA